MRIMDAILAFPPLILAMAVTLGLGAGLDTAALGIMLTSLPYYARLLRSEVLRIRSLPFIEAAHALGATARRGSWRGTSSRTSCSTLLIQAAAVFGYAILTLAALGFVGLGAQRADARVGRDDHRTACSTSSPASGGSASSRASACCSRSPRRA